MALKVYTIINHPVTSNCHVIYNDVSRHGVVIDPGSMDCSDINRFLQSESINVDYVILTHEHFDHIWSADKFGVSILCTEECARRIGDKKKNLSLFYNQIGFKIKQTPLSVESLEMSMPILGHTVNFHKNEAHSPGSMFFTIGNYIITGDLFIKNLKTVTKLPEAKKEDLKELEIWLRNMQGRGYVILPGHGNTFLLDDYDINKIY